MPEWLRQANQFSQETTIRVMLSSLPPCHITTTQAACFNVDYWLPSVSTMGCTLQPEWFLGDAKLIRLLSSLILFNGSLITLRIKSKPLHGFYVLSVKSP